jgi:hypothetical protein
LQKRLKWNTNYPEADHMTQSLCTLFLRKKWSIEKKHCPLKAKKIWWAKRTCLKSWAKRPWAKRPVGETTTGTNGIVGETTVNPCESRKLQRTPSECRPNYWHSIKQPDTNQMSIFDRLNKIHHHNMKEIVMSKYKTNMFLNKYRNRHIHIINKVYPIDN